MILEFIYKTFANLVKTMFGVIPNIPATPQAVIDGGQWVIDTISDTVGLLTALLSAELLSATIVIVLAILNFEVLYHTILWVIKKVPMINVK